MKKLIYAAAMTAALSSTAQAQEINPYVGFDLQHYSINYDNGLDEALDGGLFGGNIHIGNRFNEHFGLELGYFRMREGSKNVNFDLSGATGTPGDALTSTDVKAQGFSLDGMGYFPVGEKKSIELIGTAGISWTKAELTLNGTVNGVAGSVSDDQSEFGYRAGAGAQFHLTDQVSLRGLVRYQSMGFDSSGFDVTDNAWIYSAGVNYSF